jgi:hypothetical protein
MTARPTRKQQHAAARKSADYEALLRAQGGRCALCPAVPKTRRLDVDHDHKTMQVRGLLCHRCNRAIPGWVDVAWLRRAALYLEYADRLNEEEAA